MWEIKLSGEVRASSASGVESWRSRHLLTAPAERDALGRNLPCTVYFFEDEAGALPLEDFLLRIVRKLDLVTDYLSLKPEEVFVSALKRGEDLPETPLGSREDR